MWTPLDRELAVVLDFCEMFRESETRDVVTLSRFEMLPEVVVPLVVR